MKHSPIDDLYNESFGECPQKEKYRKYSQQQNHIKVK